MFLKFEIPSSCVIVIYVITLLLGILVSVGLKINNSDQCFDGLDYHIHGTVIPVVIPLLGIYFLLE